MILTDFSKIKFGSADITAVYAGAVKIWPAASGDTGDRRTMRFTTTDGNTWNKDNISAYTADNRLIEPIEKTATGWTYAEDVEYLASSPHLDPQGNLLTFNGFDSKIKISSANSLFSSEKYITEIDTKKLDVSEVNNLMLMFNGCNALTALDVSHFNTSKVTDMQGMFISCSSLTSLDLSNWDTSKVTDMRDMFEYCSSLTSLDLSNWGLTNVAKMGNMFNDCTSLKTITMKNCSQDTIDKIKAALTDAGILDNVQIIVSEKPTELHYVYTEDDVIYDTAIKTTVSTKFRVKGKLRGRMEGGFYVGHQGNDDADDFRLFMPFDTLKWMFDCGESRFTDVFGATKDGDLFDITCGNNYIINNLTQERQEGDVQTNIADVPIKLRLPFAYTNSLQIWQGEELVFDASVSDDLKFIDNLTGAEIVNSSFIFI